MSMTFRDPTPGIAAQFGNLANQVRTLQQVVAGLTSGVVIDTQTPGTGNNTPVPPPIPSTGGSGQIDPITGQPLPNAPPILIQQGVLPVTDLVIVPGAYINNIYADVTWSIPQNSNALYFLVQWGTVDPSGAVHVIGTSQVGGNSYRITALQPNTMYAVQILAANMVGQSISTPSNGFLTFETTQDQTVPPPVSSNGRVLVGAGATSVVVSFQPLTEYQAPDVAWGNGVYLVQISNDPNFGTIYRQMYTTAWVVAFNDVYGTTTLTNQIASADGPGVSESFGDLSFLTPGAQFKAMIDDEFILFNAPSGNTATIAQRNVGNQPLPGGPEFHAAGAKVIFASQTTWYARVAPIDSSGNQGPWTVSSGSPAGGVTDSMMVGEFSASRITFGTMSGSVIQVGSITASQIGTGTLSAATIILNGGSLIAGNPPTTGLVINSQGLTLYANGAVAANLNANNGSASFTGALTGSTITSSLFQSASTAPRSLLSTTQPNWNPNEFTSGIGGAATGGLQFNLGGSSEYGIYAAFSAYVDTHGVTGLVMACGGSGAISASAGGGAYTPPYISVDSTGTMIYGTNVNFDSADNNMSVNVSGSLQTVGNVTAPWFLGPLGTSTGSVTASAYGANNIDVVNGGSFIQINASAFTARSDARMKSGVRNLKDEESDALFKLRPVRYCFKHDPDQPKFGFVAQEVAEAHADLVQIPDDPELMWGLDYSHIVALLVHQVQKMRSELDALTTDKS